MTIQTTPYLQQKDALPDSGQIISGHIDGDNIVVYQAYKKEIAAYATENQALGGPHFSYNRMSWIKPNFLWMMYRCGWAGKENQEHVIAIWIKTSDLDIILANAAYSSYQTGIYIDRYSWEKDLGEKDVRLQWDPDHDPYGNKLNRRAIQLGLKGKMLETFGREMVQRIENITPFVKEQKIWVDAHQPDRLQVPVETSYITGNDILNKKLGIG